MSLVTIDQAAQWKARAESIVFVAEHYEADSPSQQAAAEMSRAVLALIGERERIADAIAKCSPTVTDAIRNAVRTHVMTFYMTADGDDAEPKMTSPVMQAIAAIDKVFALLNIKAIQTPGPIKEIVL